MTPTGYCHSCQGVNWHAPACPEYLAAERMRMAGRKRPHGSSSCRCAGCVAFDEKLGGAK